MKAKYNYTKPVIIIELCELCDILAASSFDVKDEHGDEKEDFAPINRGEWGDLWSNTKIQSCSYDC